MILLNDGVLKNIFDDSGRLIEVRSNNEVVKYFYTDDGLIEKTVNITTGEEFFPKFVNK